VRVAEIAKYFLNRCNYSEIYLLQRGILERRDVSALSFSAGKCPQECWFFPAKRRGTACTARVIQRWNREYPPRAPSPQSSNDCTPTPWTVSYFTAGEQPFLNSASSEKRSLGKCFPTFCNLKTPPFKDSTEAATLNFVKAATGCAARATDLVHPYELRCSVTPRVLFVCPAALLSFINAIVEWKTLTSQKTVTFNRHWKQCHAEKRPLDSLLKVVPCFRWVVKTKMRSDQFFR